MADNAVVRFARETRAELSKVTWPTRQEATNLTLVVLGTVVVSSLILGGFDLLFAQVFAFVLGIKSN
ncbi:MAG: preprotein translocase subunit SecE [Chloroflexi bacterium]|nr:preprotein translocase subunit SecE [Chloroflexota bacterium]